MQSRYNWLLFPSAISFLLVWPLRFSCFFFASLYPNKCSWFVRSRRLICQNPTIPRAISSFLVFFFFSFFLKLARNIRCDDYREIMEIDDSLYGSHVRGRAHHSLGNNKRSGHLPGPAATSWALVYACTLHTPASYCPKRPVNKLGKWLRVDKFFSLSFSTLFVRHKIKHLQSNLAFSLFLFVQFSFSWFYHSIFFFVE